MGDSYLDLLMAQEEETFEEAEGGGGVWVVADLVDGDVAPVTLEAIGAARTLADSLGAYVYGVLLGDGVADSAQMLYQAGADGARVADHPTLASFAVESYLELLADLFEEEQPEIVLFGATEAGQELAPRLAQRMGGGLIEHVTAVSLDEATRAVEAAYPIYGGEYFEIAACPEARPQFLTIEPGAFPMPFLDEYRKGEPTMLEVDPSTSSGQAPSTSSGQAPSTSSGQAPSASSGQAPSTSSGQAPSTSSGQAPSTSSGQAPSTSRRGEPVEPSGHRLVEPRVQMVGPAEGFEPPVVPLSEAAVIVAIGRQVGDPELAKQLASALNARMAGDRGAWDAGLITSEQIVDVRGVTVAPQIYVAVGIRGDTFHDAAIEEAKFVAAIHPDPTAPIFEVADMCLEAEPREVLPALLEAL